MIYYATDSRISLASFRRRPGSKVSGETADMNARRIDSETERAVHAFLERVREQYDVVGAVLFGSRARGGYRPDSDADIAVVLRGHRGPFLDTKLALADIAYEVFLETDVLIQPLPVWEDEWAQPDHYTNPALLQNIRREGVRL